MGRFKMQRKMTQSLVKRFMGVLRGEKKGEE
jgi:hypothetical protein